MFWVAQPLGMPARIMSHTLHACRCGDANNSIDQSCQATGDGDLQGDCQQLHDTTSRKTPQMMSHLSRAHQNLYGKTLKSFLERIIVTPGVPSIAYFLHSILGFILTIDFIWFLYLSIFQCIMSSYVLTLQTTEESLSGLKCIMLQLFVFCIHSVLCCNEGKYWALQLF